MHLSLQKKSSCVPGRVGLRPWLSESKISCQPPPGGSSSFLFKLRERVLNLPSSLPHLRFPLPSFPLPSPVFPLFPDFTHVCWVYFCLSFSLSLSTEVCVCLIIGRRDLFFFLFCFLLFKWWIVGVRSKASPVVFWLPQKGGAAGSHPSCLVIGVCERYQPHRSLCVCSLHVFFRPTAGWSRLRKNTLRSLPNPHR